MKAITISQPFASLIADRAKVVENRFWKTKYRGPLAIHAGKGLEYLSREELASYPTGAVIAVAELVACVSLEEIRWSAEKLPSGHCGARTWKFIAEHKYVEGPYCWLLEDVRKLDDPIPATGKQGLWEVAMKTHCKGDSHNITSPKDWTAADWQDLHNAIEKAKRVIKKRHKPDTSAK